MLRDDIVRRFTYHAPDDIDRRDHTEVRNACEDLAHRLNHLLPDGREKSTAITKLEEVMFWANASVARR
jgi:hypothetical protein